MHVPFCRRKCHYCAFYSVEPEGSSLELFLAALRKEIAGWKRSFQFFKPIRTLYIGGGTPTVLSIRQWERLASLLDENFDLSELEELTIEANPESLKDEHLDFWTDWRVTRISLGIQSLQDRELLRLGRLHDSRQALDALDASLSSGLMTSCDIIYGIPGQNLQSWHETIRTLVHKGVSHISTYELSIEPGSAWAEAPPGGMPPGYPLYRWGQYYFSKKGYFQYEVSSYSRGERWCLHNLGYWYGRNCIGIGPSAWGLIKGRRYKNVASLEVYCKRLDTGYGVKEFSERLPRDEAAAETAILATRTSWGLDLERFENRFGPECASRLAGRLAHIPARYLLLRGKRAALTREGLRVGNSLWELLLSDS